MLTHFDDNTLLATIKKMSSEFDTHQFILVLAHSNQSLYVAALAECESATPFKELHGKIGKALKKLSLDSENRFEENDASTISEDIFKNKNECGNWVKK